MVWKIVILSIAIVIASFVIAGGIVAAQVLSGNVNIRDIEGQGSGNSGRSAQNSSPPAIEGTKVSIVANDRSNSYAPNPVEIKAGETVKWVNEDSALHTATASEDLFDSDILWTGDAFSFTFDEEGEYTYYCDVHPNMVGTVVVNQGGEDDG